MNKMLKNIGLSIVLISTCAFASAQELKTAAQESAPKYFKKDGQMQGLCIDILNAITKVDNSLTFTGQDKFLPFKRLQKNLEAGKLDVFFGLKNTKKRKGHYIFAKTPLYSINYVVAVNIDDDVNISSFEDIKKLGKDGKILTVTGAAAGRFLKKQDGLLIEDRAKNPKTLLKMLVAKRGRFAFYHDLGLQNAINNGEFKGKIKILPVSFLKYNHSLAFTNSTPAETVVKVEKALETISTNGELEKIQTKYGLSK